MTEGGSDECGMINDELSPSPFMSLPSSLPSSFSLPLFAVHLSTILYQIAWPNF